MAKKQPAATRARIFLRTLAEREPVVGARMLRGWRRLKSRWQRRTLRNRQQVRLWGETIDYRGVLVVAPEAILHCSLSEFRLCDFGEAVVPGGWDLSQKAFADLDIYSAMKSVLKDKSCGWEATVWYRRALQRMAAGEPAKGCRTEAQLREHLARLAELYARISSSGYRSQAELFELDPDQATGDEVAVCVGRTGELLFSDGAHRLCAALLLGIESIPVQVTVRHPQWAELRSELISYAESQAGRLYQPALHPDLEAVPSAQGCEERWSMIAPRLAGGPGTALDIGANLGYFDNKLEELGYSCTAVENDPTLTRFATAIRNANGHGFEVVTDSILAGGGVRGRRYGIVLALNIFHHFLKTRQEFSMLGRLLDDLQGDEMFFEPHGADDPQMVGAYSGLSPHELTRFVAIRSGLTQIDLLGVASDGREVYHLRRPS